MASSAYSLTVDKMPVGKSFMKHRNNNGARMIPCGTPDVTRVASLCSPSTYSNRAVWYSKIFSAIEPFTV